MNLSILKLFREHVDTIPNLLPHQIATVDFLVRRILVEKQSILLFHIMGSGKTIIALIFALIVSKYKKVFIIVPNINILNIFNYNINTAENLVNTDYVIENIHIYATTSFYSLNYNDNIINYNGLAKYEDSVFIIDEAHNIFGNNTGELMTVIKNKHRVPFLLLSGSPITNTPITLTNIINLMSDVEINFNDIIIQGKKVFQITLNESGVKVIKDVLRDKVSYYELEKKELPDIVFHGRRFLDTKVVYCPMHPLQERDYVNIRKMCSNEMFEKNMTNVSLAVLGQLNLINSLDILFQDQEKELYPNLKINNGFLYGDELVTLNISSKLKYFVRTIQRLKGKHFIYFSNSTYGGFVIRNVMLSNGYSDYNGSRVSNPKMIDDRVKRFAVVTSKMKSSLEDLLEVYNSPENAEGHEIMFLFSSNIMSESYTLKEVRHIWFLTIPDTFSQYNQILGRSIRKFSYVNLQVPVNVYLLATVYGNFDEEIDSLEQFQLEEINSLPFDIKKLMYLKFKTKETLRIYSILQEISVVYSLPPHPYLIDVILGEMTRQFFYHHLRVDYRSNALRKKFREVLPDEERVEAYLSRLVDDHFFVSNKHLKKCLLYRVKSDIIVVPFSLKYNKYTLQINFRKDKNVFV
ncbi:ORF148 [Saltwater crocodilepox virus]|nr:early transcription factor small subunit [Saltwater crocodilepox virus]AVD69482.1 early transcription factor small subunit [Saltwater crocodilepox virus]QGT46586.1 ORF148 [Saltwater crocodilepox virus]QGT46801.1 ORF148 [Saltwater crocodilepox virus]QGT47017.1 ORF148 [Saltwater crocodilepox virus]